MPSLVETLGAELRRVGADLPLAELTHAADQLAEATSRCGAAMHASGHAEWLAELSAAGRYLDDAIAATASVLTGLDGYLAGIGLAGIDHAAPTARADGVAPTRAGGTPRDDPALALRTWWVERVDLLTGRPPGQPRPATTRDADADRRGAPEDPAGALRRLAHAARAGSQDAYREQLLATHPASGLQVSAPAGRVLRRLATDALGHAPGPADAAELVETTGAGRVRELLPKATEGLGPGLAGEICGRVAGGQRQHPVDVAAAWPVLVAGLLTRLGRGDDALPRLTAVGRQQVDDTVRRDGR